ncbi:glycosyltransferase family 2 protein [Paenarthrobacter sp. S56]|uniref:glycosyltransferase n=1 Tax=Paenarthrobacter sp. S56 TaxID=3138179 RepID=UPI00321ACA1D
MGEDLELTWRVYKAGYRVNFQPKALVYAESPSTMGGLWRQRVRWSRGLLQTLRMHLGMLGSTKYGPFGLFLIFNSVTMVLIPILQLAVLAVLPFLYFAGRGPIPGEVLAILGWLGLFVSFILIVFSIGLNRSWGGPAVSVDSATVALVLGLRGTRARECRGQGVAWQPGTMEQTATDRSGLCDGTGNRNHRGVRRLESPVFSPPDRHVALDNLHFPRNDRTVLGQSFNARGAYGEPGLRRRRQPRSRAYGQTRSTAGLRECDCRLDCRGTH